MIVLQSSIICCWSTLNAQQYTRPLLSYSLCSNCLFFDRFMLNSLLSVSPVSVHALSRCLLSDCLFLLTDRWQAADRLSALRLPVFSDCLEPLPVCFLWEFSLTACVLRTWSLRLPVLSGWSQGQPAVLPVSHQCVPAAPDSALCGLCGWPLSYDYSLISHLSLTLSHSSSSPLFHMSHYTIPPH